MDSEQYMGNENEHNSVSDRQSLGNVSSETNPTDTHNRLWRNNRIVEHGQHKPFASVRNRQGHAWSGFQNQGPQSDSSLKTTISNNNGIVILFCVILSVANVAVLSIRGESPNPMKCDLMGVDYVQPCADKPGDKSCYEVKDIVADRIVYRMDGEKRLLGFTACGPHVPYTNSLKCIGEFTFAMNATSLWGFRLYEDAHSGHMSIVAGPHNVQLSDEVYRMRHFLTPPYNWIISKDPIPKNEHPEYSLYVKGDVLFDR